VFCSAFHRACGWRRAIFLLVLLAATGTKPAATDEPMATPAPAPAAAPSAPPSGADLVAEFQKVEAEARALDPTSADAAARLRSLVERLARANAQLTRDLAQLRALLEARTLAAPARISTSAARTPARTPAARPQTVRPLPGSPAAPAADSDTAGTAFFAKRGLKKFHRAGCLFGERIKVEERVLFPTATAAANIGLEPCKVCRPE
jgi:hypothetical protein